MNCQAFFFRILLAAMLVCLGALNSHASTAAPVTQLSGQSNVSPALQLLDDVDGSVSVEELFGRWHTLSGRARPNGLSEGFSRHAVWVRFSLEVKASHAGNRWLVLSNTLLDRVDVYQQRSDGSTIYLSTGEDLPISDAAAPTLLPTVPLRLEPGENRILIRIETRNAIATRIAVRDDRAMLSFEHRQLFQGGLIAGTHLIAALAGIVVALALRDRVWLLFSMFVVVSGLSLTFLLGVPGWLGLRSIPGAADKLQGVLLVLTVAAVSDFVVRLTHPDIKARPVYRWGVWLGWAVCVPASLSILAGYFSETILKLQFVILAVVPILLGNLWRQWRHGVEAAGYFLAGVGAYAFMSLIRVLRNLGVLPSAWWTEGLHEMMSVAYLCVLAFGIATRSARALAQRETLEAELAGERAARQSERDFIAILSHELRTPLATIEASARLLRDVPSLDEPARAVRYGKIERAVGRLRELFDRMLASERIRTDWQPTNIRQVDLVAIAGQVRDSATGDGGAVHVQVVPPSAGEAALVMADGSLLRVALENLVANALAYGPVGGGIQIEIGAVRGAWRIGVTDGGSPIPEAESAALFAPYVRGSRAAAGPGAGLGLFIVRRIARVHGGEAGLDHPDGKGNRFWIELPAASS